MKLPPPQLFGKKKWNWKKSPVYTAGEVSARERKSGKNHLSKNLFLFRYFLFPPQWLNFVPKPINHSLEWFTLLLEIYIGRVITDNESVRSHSTNAYSHYWAIQQNLASWLNAKLKAESWKNPSSRISVITN